MIILGMGSANERRRYTVTSSLIGWAHTENDPWVSSANPYNVCILLMYNSNTCGIYFL